MTQIEKLKQDLLIARLLAVALAVCGVMLGVAATSFVFYLDDEPVQYVEAQAPTVTVEPIKPHGVITPTSYTLPDQYEVSVTSRTSQHDTKSDTNREIFITGIFKDGEPIFELVTHVINMNNKSSSVVGIQAFNYDEELTEDGRTFTLAVNDHETPLAVFAKLFQTAVVESEKLRLYEYYQPEETP